MSKLAFEMVFVVQYNFPIVVFYRFTFTTSENKGQALEEFCSMVTEILVFEWNRDNVLYQELLDYEVNTQCCRQLMFSNTLRER